jgi:transcriptional regulator with AAA-type ATPase domain
MNPKIENGRDAQQSSKLNLDQSASDRTGTYMPAEDMQQTMIFNPADFSEAHVAVQQPTIEVVSGETDKPVYSLGKGRFTIGRTAYNDIILNDKKVSRSHASIFFENGRYGIEDLNSTNGVFVDDNQVKRILLSNGSRIKLGDTVLVFKQIEPDVALADKMAFINASPLFNWLDQDTKELLASGLTFRFYPKETVILRQNSPVEHIYFLYSGHVRVVEINEEGGERRIDTIQAGDCFGEGALLAGEVQKNSIIASSDVQLLEMDRDQLNDLLRKKPELNKAFYQMVLKTLGAVQARSQQTDLHSDRLRDVMVSTDVEIVGEDKRVKEAKRKIEGLAKESKVVLITGHTGTGKKTFARFFHKMSSHPEYPYVELSLPQIDRAHVGPAIFGVEADPNSETTSWQMGYLEMIGVGTLAITHAELLDPFQQSRLATYIRQGWFNRVYGRDVVKTGTKIVLVASGSEAEVLEKLIPELKDLLKEKIVHLPSLSQRLKDIPILTEHYLKAFSKKHGKKVSGLSREATEKLISYTWPGNVEELENVIQRAAIVTSEEVIIPGDLIFVSPSEKEIHKINILREDKIRNFLRHPLIPKVFIWFNIFMVVVMAGYTLYGGSRPEGHPLQDFGNNPGMLITWLIWFPVLPISALLLGRIWCGVCPIAGIGDIVAKVKRFNFPVPKILKRMDFWVVIISFMVLDYLEEFLGVADKPWATGMLLVVIISLAAVFCVLFERRTFCRYICPLAGMLGAYSTLSVVEVRGNKKVCQTQCGQHTCYKGTDTTAGCPMFSYPASLASSSECMMCLNCLKNCENRGVQLNVRPPLQELWRQSQPTLSLSLFGVILVGLMGRHQFPKLSYWLSIQDSLALPETLIHTSFYLLAIFIPVAFFFLSSTLSAAASQERVSENMAQYGLAFIPLAVSGHIAHIGHEILGEGIYELLSYFVKIYDAVINAIPIGSQEVTLSPFIHPSVVTFIKFLFIFSGFLASLIALFMIAFQKSKKNVLGRVMSHLMILILFFVSYVFIFTGETGEAQTASTGTEIQAAASSSQETSTQSASVPQTAQGHGAGTAVQASQSTNQSSQTPNSTAMKFSLSIPDVKDASTETLSNPVIVSWFKSARPVQGAVGQYRLRIAGSMANVPKNAQVVGSLETLGVVKKQFVSAIDPGGNFGGEIILGSLTQPVILILEAVDSGAKAIFSTHRVVLR